MTRSDLRKVWGETVEEKHYPRTPFAGPFDIWCYYADIGEGAWGIIYFGKEVIWQAVWGYGNVVHGAIVKDTLYEGRKALTIYKKLYPYWCLSYLLIPTP